MLQDVKDTKQLSSRLVKRLIPFHTTSYSAPDQLKACCMLHPQYLHGVFSPSPRR